MPFCVLLAHIAAVGYDFDPAKSERNLQERGFDFDLASLVFESNPVVFRDDRRDYGEVRMIALGEIDGNLYKVTFTDRGEVRRIISAHRASRQEIRRWQMRR